jgi:enamine deaminase RidA (YjgF/YER057c/UK114 family)
MAKIEERLQQLQIELSSAPKPAAVYIPIQQTGNLVYLSGQDCRINGKLMYEGKLGRELTIEQGKEAARQTMINCLSVLKEYLGDLDRVVKIVKLLGFVSSAEGFVDQPLVINGASELLEEVFGASGSHARSAIGTNELPWRTPVEIEMIVEVRP